MLTILQFIGQFLDLVAMPFQSLEPFWGFMAICFVMGTIVVIIFKYVSNQKKIKAVKNQIKIHFLEIRIYKDDFREVLKAQKEILKNNFRYIAYNTQGAVPVILLFLVTLSQINLRYGYDPIMPGEPFDVKVTYGQNADRRPDPLLTLPEGFEALTPALRLGGENEVSWQLRASEAGKYRIGIQTCDENYTKEIVIGKISDPFCPELIRQGFWASFVNAAEPALPKKGLLESIEIGYQPKHFKCILFGWNMHWLLVLPILAISFGLVVRKVLKVD
ncbi:MAG: hypothetical protein AB1847_16570 [bacterium]